MHRFVLIMLFSGLSICFASDILNASNIWSYWRYIPLSIWEFALFVGGMHYYSKSRIKHFIGQLMFLGMIGHCTINLIHAVWGFVYWTQSDKSIQDCLNTGIDLYYVSFVLVSVAFSILCALIYLINLPYLLNSEK